MDDFLNDLRFDLRVKNRFRLLDHVTDSDLAMLYQKAYFTLFPSLYEGWGLPLAESLAHGKFCLASNSSSLPEVGGALVDYIDPWATNLWAGRIAYYLDHPEEVVRKERLIREQYIPPSWEDTGKTLYESAVALLNSSAILRRVDDGELH